jgi:hypothetical protein
MTTDTHADQHESIEPQDSDTDAWELSLWDALLLNGSRNGRTRSTAAVARVTPIGPAGSATALKAVA